MAAVGSEQQLRFRWNDHMQHVSKILTLQRLEEQFCDVSLVSEDGFVMKAHQAILASTSTYFQRVLSEVTSDQHPMIVLRGANFREMSCLLDYMYQGNTQVDQSLMESVLEVADMLEVKGLSRIRSNATIKKFMVPCVSPSSTNVTSVHMPCTDNLRGGSRDEEQFYRGNQTDTRTTDTEGARMRLSSNICDSRSSRETPHLPNDGPPMSHAQPHSSRHESDPQDDEDVTQTSGIDLSLAKNEPWSPREGGASLGPKDDSDDDELSPSKKKRKHQENLCSEETLDPVSDPDWGRIGTKLEERPCHKPRTISLSSVNTVESDLGLLRHKNPPTKSDDAMSPVRPLVEKTLEVPCEDGPLTISLTTGQDLDGWRSIAKRKPLFYTSLPLKRAKRKFKAKKSLDEGRKKWLAKERRSLFGSDSNERPITRALERLKKKTVSAVLESMEKVSVNCDPPFPTDEDARKSSRDKENILLSKSTPEENSKVQVAIKSAVGEAKESNVWELTEKRIPDDKYEESAEDVKFPAINPLSLFTLPPVKEREKQTRTTLTLEEKVKVIEAFLDGKSQRQIAHLYGIGKTQVSGIIKRREEILTIYRDSLLRGEKLTMKRQRKSEYALLNQHLIQWYRHMTVVAGVKITTGMLRAKALQIAPELGYHDFKASNGWLATFKSNNNLKFSKQRKAESYSDQGNSQHDSSHRDDEESFFEDGETDNSSSHLPNIKYHVGPSNITAGTANDEGNTSDNAINRGSQNGESSSANPSDQGSSLIHPSLSSAGVPKPPQMVNASLGANLTAAAAYNLSRDLTRDLSRGDSTGVGDISSAAMNSSPLNHPVSALNVSRAVIDNPLSKPSDTALATYKSEEPLTYGYDPQNRMNDASSRGAEYNYTPYGFPGQMSGLINDDEWTDEDTGTPGPAEALRSISAPPIVPVNKHRPSPDYLVTNHSHTSLPTSPDFLVTSHSLASLPSSSSSSSSLSVPSSSITSTQRLAKYPQSQSSIQPLLSDVEQLPVPDAPQNIPVRSSPKHTPISDSLNNMMSVDDQNTQNAIVDPEQFFDEENLDSSLMFETSVVKKGVSGGKKRSRVMQSNQESENTCKNLHPALGNSIQSDLFSSKGLQSSFTVKKKNISTDDACLTVKRESSCELDSHQSSGKDTVESPVGYHVSTVKQEHLEETQKGNSNPCSFKTDKSNQTRYVEIRLNEGKFKSKFPVPDPSMDNKEESGEDLNKMNEIHPPQEEEPLCPLEKKVKRPRSTIKRPLNQYMLFQKEMREKLRGQHPEESNQNIAVWLGYLWRQLPMSEKAKWQARADYAKEEHKRLYPSYSYNPREAAEKRKEYMTTLTERRNLYRIKPQEHSEEN